MQNSLPGMLIEADISKSGEASRVLAAAFVTKGLVLSQVCELTGIEPYTVQNWVKRGFVSPPIDRRYTARQFCRLAIINAFKDILEIGDIVKFMSYINGSLSDESDDLIPDDELYCIFCDTVSGLCKAPLSKEATQAQIKKSAKPYPQITEKLENVLSVMVNSYFADALRKNAKETADSLNIKGGL